MNLLLTIVRRVVRGGGPLCTLERCMCHAQDKFPYKNNEAQRSTLYLMITYRKFNEKASKSSWYINVENKY